MTLIDTLKDQMNAARKTHDDMRRSILSLAVGAVQLLEGSKDRVGKPITDEDVQRVLRRMVSDGQETLKTLPPESTEKHQAVLREISVLEEFLPKLATAEVVEQFLRREGSNAVSEIRAAKSEGMGTGVAMKALKTAGIPVDGKTVGEVVRKIRE